MFSPQNILVPTDFSVYSDRALQQSIDIARQFNAKIHLLHVISVVIECGIEYCLESKTLDLLENHTILAAKDMIQKQLDKFPESKAIEIIINIRQGNIYEEILKAQQEKKVDLTVIASQGQTEFLDHLIGSVAERVLRHSNSNVLLVRKTSA
ncbi:MAG: universal stress protein [Syntrophales bacterium LBB04]|nr:universal stress protein [Syntrophales bacterium LBB04]